MIMIDDILNFHITDFFFDGGSASIFLPNMPNVVSESLCRDIKQNKINGCVRDYSKESAEESIKIYSNSIDRRDVYYNKISSLLGYSNNLECIMPKLEYDSLILNRAYIDTLKEYGYIPLSRVLVDDSI